MIDSNLSKFEIKEISLYKETLHGIKQDYFL